MFYYGIAREMYRSEIKVFDNSAVYTFLADKAVLEKGFEERGGFATVNEIMGILNEENIDAYYEDLLRNNAMLALYDEGFDVEKNFEKFSKMKANDLYDYLDYKLNHIFIGKVDKLAAEDLSTGYDEYVDSWDKGTMKGFPVGFPILNYRLAGVHKKNMLLHLAHIGNGKTTSSILFYILPAIENGENVCIIANEQGVEEFRQMILSTVLFNKIKYNKINRQRFIQGGFSQEDRKHIKQAQDWLASQEGKITFISTQDYSVGNVKKIVKKYSKLDCGLFVFDTLKPTQEGEWQDFSEMAKELFLIAKKEDVAIIATAQLSAESMSRKFLDLSCTGKSRAIAETAAQVVMFRTIAADEKEKMKVYKLHRDEETKKFTSVKDLIDLDPDKDYVVLFTPKNRFGAVSPQIVYERNMAWNQLREIGYTEISYDGFNSRH